MIKYFIAMDMWVFSNLLPTLLFEFYEHSYCKLKQEINV